MNGKGDAPRNCFSMEYRENYDSIFRKTRENTTKWCPAADCNHFGKCPMARPLGDNDNADEYDQDFYSKECYSPR